MRVKIVSDGTAAGTQLISLESNEPIEGVQLVNWVMIAEDGLSSVMLELRGVPCDILTTARIAEIQEQIQLPELFETEDEDWKWFRKTEGEK